MVTFMECSEKYASSSVEHKNVVSKLGVLDIVFGMQTDALIGILEHAVYRGYLGYLTSD